jgi:hypothetical protein
VADVPACLEAVTAKKAEYEALKEKAATEPEPEEEAAAEEEAKEEGEAAAAAADEKEEEEAEAKEEDKASSSKAEANGNAAPEANGHAKEDKEDGGEWQQGLHGDEGSTGEDLAHDRHPPMTSVLQHNQACYSIIRQIALGISMRQGLGRGNGVAPPQEQQGATPSGQGYSLL